VSARFVGEHERVGYVIGRVAGCEEIDDLPLAAGQWALHGSEAGVAVGRASKLLDEPGRHHARDRRLAGADSLQGAWQGVDVELLREESDGAGMQGQQPELVLAGTCEHDHELVGHCFDEPSGRDDAVRVLASPRP
jgi:hypothetical protein